MNEKHLNKIQKCFDLAKSGNAHEAANALAMAQKLMKKYGMSDEDIQFMSMGETTSKSTIQQKPVVHVSGLIVAVAKAFGVSALHHYCGDTGKCHPLFVGVKDKAMTAAYAFDVVYRQLKIARRNYIKENLQGFGNHAKTVKADVYCLGWVKAAVENIKPMEVTDEEQQRVEAFKNNRNPELKDEEPLEPRQRKGGSIADLAAGEEDGSKITLSTPVSGTESLKIEMSI